MLLSLDCRNTFICASECSANCRVRSLSSPARSSGAESSASKPDGPQLWGLVERTKLLSSQRSSNSTRSTCSTSGSEAKLKVKQGPEERRSSRLLDMEETAKFSSEDQRNCGFSDLGKEAKFGSEGDGRRSGGLWDQCASLPTTLMIYDIPCRVSLRELLQAICDRGFENSFDFLHLPMRHRKKNPKHTNLGYAFINFESPELAASFIDAFKGFHFESMRSTKALLIKKAHLQGRSANEEQFGRKFR
mmetsp:Transcript_32068/g.70140  ORF Transcript_32068/g.70140 Transcript_32068/m.70140 type:complete len:247 (-) Transcript_32068:43-783(-)